MFNNEKKKEEEVDFSKLPPLKIHNTAEMLEMGIEAYEKKHNLKMFSDKINVLDISKEELEEIEKTAKVLK